MLKIERLIVGQLQTNCYLLVDKKEKELLIIDPGDDADYITRVIDDLEVKPKAILATHGHFDHILAAWELQMAYKIPFIMSKEDEFLLAKMKSSAKFYSKINAGPPPTIDTYIKGGEKFVIGHLSFDILETPGHTPGSVSLYSKKEGILFCGDLVFAQGHIGRADFSYSSSKDLDDSIAKILSLPPETRILPGHGVETTVRQAKLYNLYN